MSPWGIVSSESTVERSFQPTSPLDHRPNPGFSYNVKAGAQKPQLAYQTYPRCESVRRMILSVHTHTHADERRSDYRHESIVTHGSAD